MSLSFSAVIVAAGESRRFRTDPKFPGLSSKTFIEWEGRPLFIHTIEKLCAAIEFRELVLVIRKDDQELFEDALSKLDPLICTRLRIALGGARRMDSVRHGLEALASCDRVAVHDAARPFLDLEFLNALMRTSAEHDAVVPAIPVTETLKEVNEENKVIKTHDRRRFFRAQTPQVFSYDRLMALHEKYANSEIELTDDAMLFELEGLPVQICEGSMKNIKITVPEDLIQSGVSLNGNS